MKKKKLYLFDIDGTLLSPGPDARQIINTAIEEKTGKNPDLQISDVAGFTDLVIIRNALHKLNFNGEAHALIGEILETYLHRFSQKYNASESGKVFQDAVRFLDHVMNRGHAVGLLTGNVKRGAEIKLNKFDLFHRFPFGAFGDDAEDRMGLPSVARERAWEILGEAYRYEDMIIVGDTVQDVLVANDHGMESIIVCRVPEWEQSIVDAGAFMVVHALDEAIAN